MKLFQITKSLLLFISILFPLVTFGVNSDVPKDVVLVSANSFSSDNQQYLSISYKNHEKWHTYWKNPGDAGLPLKFTFKSAGKEIILEELEWPTPRRYLEEGNMWAYGYEGEYSFFFKISPEQMKSFNGQPFEVMTTWLVCKHICVPGKKVITGNFEDDFLGDQNNDFSISNERLSERFQSLPKVQEVPSYLDIVLAKNPDKELGLILYSNVTNDGGSPLVSNINLLTPFPSPPLTFLHEEVFKDKKTNYYGKFPIDWDGEYLEPPVDLPKDGVFKKPYEIKFLFADPVTQKVSIIAKTFKSFNLTAAQSNKELFKMLTKIPIGKKAVESNKKIEVVSVESNSSLFYYFILAFIGGFILNFMPCVLPVISMKLFGLISHSNESKSRIFKHNMFYSLGVILSFLALASVVILLQKAGTTVGWGFQLQSPTFIAITILVLFVMTLNLFGLFEFVTPGGGKLGNVELSDSYLGDIFGGVIATILSTPCSAPFLGTALTFAFSSSAFTIISVFIFIGLGLAFPFILTALFPKLISFLPKPGNWMNHLKKFLGFTLLLTVIWLLDIFVSQTDTNTPLLKLATILVFIFFGFFMRLKISKDIKLSALVFAIPAIMFINLLMSPMVMETGQAEASSSLLKEKQNAGLPWVKFSEEKLQEHLDKGYVTFIDFTAKWCFTCKVNEKVVLETDAFRELIKQKNVKLLLADWTKRDEKIGQWLKDHGKVGVPAYFILDRDGKLHNLGETISISKIKKYL